MTQLRVYVAGDMQFETAGLVLGGNALQGRIGRRALAWLLLHHTVPSTRDALAAATWGDDLPEQWPNSLSALLSKLRSALARVGVEISSSSGTLRLVLPPDAWLDFEVALSSLESAEAAFKRGPHGAAFGPLAVTIANTRQPLLPGEEADWLTPVRERLARARSCALALLADIWIANGEPGLAIEAATELTRIEPYLDGGYQRLMRAYLQRGDRAMAVQAYGRFRELIANEMGVDPSSATEQLYLDALRG